MHQLKKISAAIAVASLSTAMFMSQSIAATNDGQSANNASSMATTDISPVTNGVSQKLMGNSKTVSSLKNLLPVINYTTDNLSPMATKVNEANWKAGYKNRSYHRYKVAGTIELAS